jgi:hypothetical protein
VLKSIFLNLTSFLKENKMAKDTFKVAGVTTHNGNSKVRFTDDMVRRVKQFSKGGATRIDLVELPSEMTKIEALKFLQAHADFQTAGDQALISDSLADREKAPKSVKVKVTKANKPNMASIKAKASKTKEVTAEQLLKEVGVASM